MFALWACASMRAKALRNSFIFRNYVNLLLRNWETVLKAVDQNDLKWILLVIWWMPIPSPSPPRPKRSKLDETNWLNTILSSGSSCCESSNHLRELENFSTRSSISHSRWPRCTIWPMENGNGNSNGICGYADTAVLGRRWCGASAPILLNPIQ